MSAQFATQFGRLIYEIRMSGSEKQRAREKEEEIKKELGSENIYDIEFDWDASEGEEDGNKVFYATLSFSTKSETYIRYGSIHYDEDNDAVTDSEPDTMEGGIDTSDMTSDVKLSLAKFGLHDIYLVDSFLDSLEEIIDREEDMAEARLLCEDDED